MNTIPSVGSLVSVTTKFRNINYFTSEKEPFTFSTIKGRVVRSDKWMGASQFAVATGNKVFPIATIAIRNVDELEVLEGGDNTFQQFPVMGSKGAKYIVSKNGDHYSCDCTGFKYHSKCKHINIIRNDYYE